MFGRLKEWGRVAMRYAHTFFSAICSAATGFLGSKYCVLTLDRHDASFFFSARQIKSKWRRGGYAKTIVPLA